MAVRYSTAETALARLFRANEEAQQGALRGRLKRLSQLGVPQSTGIGRGRAWYSEQQLVTWAFALELEEAGFGPQDAAEFVLGDFFKKKILPKLDEHHAGRGMGDHYLCISPHLISKAWTAKSSFTTAWVSEPDLARWISRHRCVVVIDAASLLSQLAVERVFADTNNPAERVRDGR